MVNSVLILYAIFPLFLFAYTYTIPRVCEKTNLFYKIILFFLGGARPLSGVPRLQAGTHITV